MPERRAQLRRSCSRKQRRQLALLCKLAVKEQPPTQSGTAVAATPCCQAQAGLQQGLQLRWWRPLLQQRQHSGRHLPGTAASCCRRRCILARSGHDSGRQLV